MLNVYNNETCSRNHFCSGRTISITYSEFVFVAMCMRHVVILAYNSPPPPFFLKKPDPRATVFKNEMF